MNAHVGGRHTLAYLPSVTQFYAAGSNNNLKYHDVIPMLQELTRHYDYIINLCPQQDWFVNPLTVTLGQDMQISCR